MIVLGMGVTQAFEAQHYAHFMHCLSQVEEFNSISQYVVACSNLLASAFIDIPGSNNKATYWYLNVANPDGTPVEEIFASSGYAHSPFENWYGMAIHAYAELANPTGEHLLYLEQMYGTNLDDLPFTSSGNHLDRAQVMHMASAGYTEPDIIEPPAPEPEIELPAGMVTWKDAYVHLMIRSGQIVGLLQSEIRELKNRIGL